jgi:hypothetical protein
MWAAALPSNHLLRQFHLVLFIPRRLQQETELHRRIPSCQDAKDLFIFFAPLPFASLSRALDILDVHLESGEILARWDTAVQLRFLLQSARNKEAPLSRWTSKMSKARDREAKGKGAKKMKRSLAVGGCAPARVGLMSAIFECLPVWDVSGGDPESDKEATATTLDSSLRVFEPYKQAKARRATI